MTCNNLGLWASGTTSLNICDLTPSITLYGDSVSVGETIWDVPGCLPSDANIPDTWWSNGTVYFQYDGGVQQIVSVSACTTTPTPSPTPTVTPTNTPDPTKTPTLTPTITETPTQTPTVTPSVTETPTQTPTQTPTITPSLTETPTQTPTPTPTITETPTQTPTVTPSVTETPTQTPTQTPTVTPTMTETPTQTPTQTPTPTSTPSADYCIYNTVTYDGNYLFTGTYNGYSYYSNLSSSIGVIFYSPTEDRWCLASSLGDPCVQFGAYNSETTSPDLDDTVMYLGVCITTTTTTNPCNTLDIDAIFDCYIPPTPSVSPTPSVTPTLTPTPTSSDPCGGRFVSASGFTVSSSPTPTPTPTPTATPIIDRPCNFSGEVIFNSISEIIQCANSKKFKDCFTGIDYFTSESLFLSGGTTPKEGYVYNAIINGQGYCVIYEGLFENISGVDNIELTYEVGPSNEGACLQCNALISPTPTQTPTSTPTPTPTSSPCVTYQYRVTNLSPAKLSVQYVDCVKGFDSISLLPNSSIIICSTTLPTSNNPQNVEITPLGFIC